MKRSIVLAALAALVLAALPAAAADPVIHRGIDPWTTVPDGTFVDFKHNPLPAGFFCSASPAFTDVIWLQGVPLASDSPTLGRTDTIVERLDDAAFNRRGVARTRFQVRALQLEGIETLKNSCGEYYVQLTLDGEQPITTMRILRENARGGRFLVPVKINTKVVFTAVDDPSNRLEFAYPITFPVNPHSRWIYRNLNLKSRRVPEAMVDTDWDGAPDSLLPGTSNFGPGLGLPVSFGTVTTTPQLKHAHHTVID